MKIAYIAHPISGDVQANLADLRRIVRKINLQYRNVLPFVPYYVDIVSMNDEIQEERERGLQNDVEIIKRKMPDELWLTGEKVSQGMIIERDAAIAAGIPVYNYINQL
jgi:hypothetical protein